MSQIEIVIESCLQIIVKKQQFEFRKKLPNIDMGMKNIRLCFAEYIGLLMIRVRFIDGKKYGRNLALAIKFN